MILSYYDFDALCKIAETAAREAGEYIQSQLNQQYEFNAKKAGSSLASQIVTEVDIKAQEIILKKLDRSIKEFDLGLLTEEYTDDSSRLIKDYFWCIDPMDGTKAFTEGRSGYAVSIALVSKAGDPVIGVVYLPDSKDCYTAIKGAGLQLNKQIFVRKESTDNVMHFYRDASLQSAPYYDLIINKLKQWSEQHKFKFEEHVGYGAVRNALGVLHADVGCYSKYPKTKTGGGSIWDFAATRLFFEELGLPVADSFNKPLHLNDSISTYMNHKGVLFATSVSLVDFIQNLKEELE